MLKRKGDPTDILLLLVMLFFLAISLIVALYANTKIYEVISTTELNTSAAYDSISESFIYINDYTTQRGFTIFFGFLIVGIVISSFLVRVHPVFIAIYIITLGMSVFTSLYLANTYELFVASGQIAAFASKYSVITWTMQHIATILLGVGALSMIIIFGKIGSNPTTSEADI